MVASSYEPIHAWKGMPLILPKYKENEGTTDFTWVVWMILGILGVGIVGTAVWLGIKWKDLQNKKKGYAKFGGTTVVIP